jgi:chemotaxis response regulator CheB
LNPILLASDNASVVAEIQRILQELIGPFVIELICEDGRIALRRLERRQYRLVLLPSAMRHYEALTVLRMLDPTQKSPVVLLVPDTVEGLRTGWEALRRGAVDILPTKGDPAQRLKGLLEQRRRQISAALNLSESGTTCPDPWSLPEDSEPTVWLPELRHLTELSESLSKLPRTFPLLIRIPEGPRMRRVAGEELARTTPWPVRQLQNGDRLMSGRVHLFSDPDAVALVGSGDNCTVRLHASAGTPGSADATHELYRSLGRSTTRFRLVAGSSFSDSEGLRQEDSSVEADRFDSGSGEIDRARVA